MEKYRRWTDEKVGVNPFVAAKTETSSLAGKLVALLAKLIKAPCLLLYLPIFVMLYSLPIAWVSQKAARVLLLLFGVYSIEDFSLERCDKQRKANIILSNHVCFVDVVYYLYRYPGYSFLSFIQAGQGIDYSLVSPLKAFLRSLTRVQPFFSNAEGKGFNSLKDCLYHGFGDIKSAKLIVFYEKIRTNGKGTIRIEKNFCDQLYELGQDWIIAQLKYTTNNHQLFSLTSSPLSVVLAALGSLFPGNELKIKAIKQSAGDTHSSNQLRQAVNSMALGPLVETAPESYFEFIEFFKRTSREEYKSE